MEATAPELSNKEIAGMTAKRYLADKAYLYLLGKPQTAKIRQVATAVEVEGTTPRLIRDVMASDERFMIIDRRLAPAVRYGDTKRPFERILAEIFVSAGMALTVEATAGELAATLGRPAEYYEDALPRVFSDKQKYFRLGDKYGLTSWLLIPTSDEEDDIVFDNFLTERQVEEFTGLCPAVSWSVADMAKTAASMVKDCKEPIPFKIMALMAWRAMGEDFDAVDFYSAVIESEDIIVLSDQKLYSRSAEKGFLKTLADIAEELAKLPMEAEEEESEGPVQITDTDKEEIISLILQRGSASAEELIETILEVGSDESAFAGTLENLNTALTGDERIMWLGGTRWSKVETFPDEVTVIPDSLVVPQSVAFETPEGDVYDQELEEDGFEGDLKVAIYNPLSEDVTDEDPARTLYAHTGDTQRCVLKYHHKQEGTFPLCQISPDFFGPEPEIIPINLIDEGKRKTAYVNNNTRLIYGLKDLYKDITEVSGAVFYLEKTAKPGEYRFRHEGEVDDQLGVDTNRSLELLDLKARFESTDMPVYDVICEILGRQGMTFVRLVNEVNIVKRCSRLLVASILSSYHCFHTRGKSDQWLFDEKKKSQGFNKTKRKYIKK